LLPDNNAVPPLEAAYQSITLPEVVVAEMVTVPAPQREALPAVGAAGLEMTEATTAVLVVETARQEVFVFLDSA
jgi:hypothetical protein